jgi:hypothetical protein
MAGADTLRVQIHSNKTIMCTGDTAAICAPAGFALYTWNNGDSTTCIYTTIAAPYTLTVTDSAGCPATSNQVSVSNYPASQVSISVNGDTLSSYNAVTYQWYLNGNAITGDTARIAVARKNGNYTVQISDTNGCYYTSSATTITTSINTLLAENLFNIYPNPANITLYIKVTGPLPETPKLYNVSGQLIYTGKFIPELDVSTLSPGAYFIELRTGAEVARRMFVKM